MITGIAAQTDASKRSWTPRRGAAAKSSAPRRATSCLFAVTTGLPGASSSSTCSRGLEPAHHLGDDADRRVVADLRGVGRQHARLRVEARSLVEVAHERPHDAQPVPGRALDVVGVLGEQPVDGRADRPVAEEGDATST